MYRGAKARTPTVAAEGRLACVAVRFSSTISAAGQYLCVMSPWRRRNVGEAASKVGIGVVRVGGFWVAK
eukprot:4718060-Lingulodinium_polyedra.AAC.1